jgi:hypothetical protein
VIDAFSRYMDPLEKGMGSFTLTVQPGRSFTL